MQYTRPLCAEERREFETFFFSLSCAAAAAFGPEEDETSGAKGYGAYVIHKNILDAFECISKRGEKQDRHIGWIR